MRGLNLACGEHADKADPGLWVNVDRYSMGHWAKQPDVLADALGTLPFAPYSFDRVYLGHFLEHLEHPELTGSNEMGQLFQEIRRVARPGASVGIVGPCWDNAIATDQPQWLLDIIKPPARFTQPKGIEHRWLSTGRGTLQLIRRLVDPHAELVPAIEMFPPTWPNPSGANWQFAIRASLPR